ncbi:MAG: hypothetical protein AAFR61_20245 [Bacteroidota bacterium]
MPIPPWKVLPLIGSLVEREEIEPFRHWIQEKSRVSDNKVSSLFEVLVAAIEKKEVHTLSSQACWAHIRPEDPFTKASDNQLRQYRSELKDKIDRFIMEQALDQDHNEWVRLLYYQELADRGLHGLLDKAYRLQLDKWKDRDVLDLKDLFFLFETEQMRNQQRVQETKVKATYLSNVIERFIEFGLTTYLKLACINFSENAVLPNAYQPVFLDELLEMLSAKALQPEQGLLFVYFQLYQFLDGKSDDLDALLACLNPANTTLREGELRDLYGLLQNGLTRRSNMGGFAKWAPKLLDLFQWGRDVGAVFQSGKIDPRVYRNIVLVALRLERRQDAFDLMEELRPFLPPGTEEYYHYCKGYYYYVCKEFDKMKDQDAWSPTQPFQNIRLRIESDMILLQADYERFWGTGEEEEIHRLKERTLTLQRFIKSQKSLAGPNKESLIQRLKYFKRLTRNLKVKDLERFYREVQEAVLLGNKSWFLYQIQWRLDTMEGEE